MGVVAQCVEPHGHGDRPERLQPRLDAQGRQAQHPGHGEGHQHAQRDAGRQLGQDGGDGGTRSGAAGAGQGDEHEDDGRASPSLRPDSTFSSERSRSGTSRRTTMALANTGSVGASTAPSSSEDTQSRPVSSLASTATPSHASGSPIPRARAGCRHAWRIRGSAACIPSVNSTPNSATSAVATTTGLCSVKCTSPSRPGPTTAPASRNSSEVENTERAASPESSTATSSAAAKTAIRATRAYR